MLKEVRTLRDFVRAAIQNDCDKPMASRLITEAERAVRGDEKTQAILGARKALKGTSGNHLAERVAAAIRGKR